MISRLKDVGKLMWRHLTKQVHEGSISSQYVGEEHLKMIKLFNNLMTAL
jgi:hypothetical protein